MKKIVLSLVVMLLAVFSAKALVYTVVVPEGTKACYIAGSMTGWGHEQMEQDPDESTIFTIDLPEATVADGYKYCCGPGWAWVEKNADGGEIDNRTYPDDDMNIDYVETWALEYDPELDNEVTLNVTVPEETKAVYVLGSFNNWDMGDFRRLEQVTETTYTITVRVIGSESVNYKYASGPSWDYEELLEDGSILPVDRKLAVSDSLSDDVVALWKDIFDPEAEKEFTLNVTVPEGTNAVYVNGSFNGWSGFKSLQKVTETTYTVTLNVDGLEQIEYKYASGPDWKYVEVQEDGGDVDNRTLAAVDSPSEDVVAAWKEISDPPTVTLTVTVPEGTNACYVAGSMNGWTQEEMEKVTESSDLKSAQTKQEGEIMYSITLNVVGFEEIEYKYCSGPDWKYEELQADGSGVPNRKLAISGLDSSSDDVVAEWKEIYETGINKVNVNNTIIVGGKATVTVQFNGIAKVELYTVQGVLLNKTLATAVYNYAGLPAGIYIVKINNKAYKALVK